MTFVKTMNVLDIVVYASAILLYCWDFAMPPMLAEGLSSVVGLSLILFASAYMILYTKPITGIIFVFLAYRLVQMSQTFVPYTNSHTLHSSSFSSSSINGLRIEPIVMPQYSVKSERTLEEAMVAKYAPIGVQTPVKVDEKAINTAAKPVSSMSTYAGVPI